MSSYGRNDYNRHQHSGLKRERADDGMNNMDQKKVKTEHASPSKVIHIRSLPAEIIESEIEALGRPFGRVTNVLLLKTKHQAFLELSDIEEAKTMVDFYKYSEAQIRGKTVIMQYSQHQELKTQDNKPRQDSQDSRRDGSIDRGQGHKVVIKVIVTNLVYPVTIDVLESVFSRCGKIDKIVTFTRNDQFHALIQYSTPKEAQAARTLFDGQNIYNGCNTLHIEYSKLDQLEVKFNNEKSRDFTKPKQDMIDPLVAAQMQMAAMNPTGLLASPPPMMSLFPGQMFNPAAMAGMMQGGMAPPFMQHSPGSMSPRGAGMGHHGGSVLLVSNLSEEDVCCDDLFILFGHYGDVQRIKILFNKKDTALIQFSDSSQAQTAQSNLNGVRLHGKEMRVSKSKHDNVNMPKSEDEGKELTKDYNGSPLHRFKKPGSKNFQNIFSPIRTLHLSNIPESTTEEDLKDLFTEYGAITNFRFFPKDRRMALMQLGSPEEAILCLIRLHNFKLNESSHLRVSFAKNEM